MSDLVNQNESPDKKQVHKVFKEKPYWNPYLAGIALGLVLLSAFVIMGRGLGASGAMSTVVAVGYNTVAPSAAHSNNFFKEYLGDGTKNPLKDWLVFEVIGITIGGFLSGIFSGRVRKDIQRGPHITDKKRLIFALLGGILMGIGAKLARGCTSGQALTGGAILNLGSWAFMLCVFAGGYMLAYFLRRQWL